MYVRRICNEFQGYSKELQGRSRAVYASFNSVTGVFEEFQECSRVFQECSGGLRVLLECYGGTQEVSEESRTFQRVSCASRRVTEPFLSSGGFRGVQRIF